jgi:GT2 family glycosyltransferase
MTSPLVYVVILNWNRKADTLECIGSLMDMDYPNFRILVVDNGSSDGSVEDLKANFPSLELVVNEVNLGVAEGRNVGIQHALENGTDFVALLDSDTVVEPCLLSKLVEVGEADPEVGMVVPKIYSYWERDRIASAGSRRRWFPPGRISIIGLDKKDSADYNQQRELDYATGCALLVKRDVFEKVGMFDPVYAYGWDDYDFCEQVTRGGYKIIYVPNAKLWHKVASKREEQALKWYRLGRTNVYFYRKYVSMAYLALPIYALWILAREMILGNRKAVGPYLKGVWDELWCKPSRPLPSV